MTTLERAADFREQRAAGRPFLLLVCPDLASVDTSLDTRNPISDAAVKAAIDHRSKELTPLRGSTLYFTGVGRVKPGSKARADSIRQVTRVLRGVAERVGARVGLIDTQLGETLPEA